MPHHDTTWAFEALGIGMWSVDLESGRVRWERQMAEFTGHAQALTFEAWTQQVSHPDDRNLFRGLFAKAAKRQAFDVSAARILRPDGEIRWLRLCGRCGADVGGTDGDYVIVAQDVSDNVLMQKRLAEAERLETLGQFSAGVSHNFNNMLMVVGACLDLLGHRIDPTDTEAQRDLEDAREATARAAEIVSRIADLGRMETQATPGRTRISKVCEVVERLFRRSLPDTIGFSTSIHQDPVVEVLPGSLEQVLQNLLNNARDALLEDRPPNPRVTLSASTTTVGGDAWVEIIVSDNGPGIDPAVEDRLFEPFVTTKGSKGTGLGLASSSALMHRLGGQLMYRPGSPRGSEFLVSVPVATSPDVAPVLRHVPRSEPQWGGRVLVIDDEPAIRRVVAATLRHAGIESDTASSRAQVEHLLAHGERDYDVVLLDLSLGVERGSDLLPVLRFACPEARILYFTGEPVQAEQLADVDGLLKKPMQLETLLDAVRGPA